MLPKTMHGRPITERYLIMVFVRSCAALGVLNTCKNLCIVCFVVCVTHMFVQFRAQMLSDIWLFTLLIQECLGGRWGFFCSSITGGSCHLSGIRHRTFGTVGRYFLDLDTDKYLYASESTMLLALLWYCISNVHIWKNVGRHRVTIAYLLSQ